MAQSRQVSGHERHPLTMGMQYPEAGSRSSRDAAKEKALGSIPCAASAFPYPVPQYGFQRQHISEYQHRQMYQYPPRLLQDHQHPDDHQLRQRQEKTLSPRQDSHASTSTSRSIGSSSAFKLPPYTVATVRLYNLLRRRTKDRAFMLPRNLSYSAKHAPEPIRQHIMTVNVLSIKAGRTHHTPPTLSLIMAACEVMPSLQGYLLHSAKIIQLSTGRPDQGCKASIDVPQSFAANSLHKGLLFILWEDHMDLSVLRKRPNAPLNTGVHLTLSGMALLLGVIPNQSRCRWAFVPISRHDTRALAVLNKGYVYCDPEVLQAAPHRNACVRLSGAGSGGKWPANQLTNLAVSILISQVSEVSPTSVMRQNLCTGGTESMASLMMGATTVKRLGPYGQKVCPTLFHYLSSEARPMNLSHTELTEHWSCPLCTMMCSSLLGLSLHVKASHDLFDYVFVRNAQRGIPEVLVKCWPYEVESTEFTSSLRLPLSGSSIFVDTASKEFCYVRCGLKNESCCFSRKCEAIKCWANQCTWHGAKGKRKADGSEISGGAAPEAKAPWKRPRVPSTDNSAVFEAKGDSGEVIVISDTEAGDSEEAVLNSNEEVGGSMPPQEVDSEKGAVSAAISVNHSTERLPTFQKVLMARAAEPAVLEDDPYPVMEDNSNQPEAVDEPLEQMPASEGRAETIPEDTIEAVPPRLPVFKMAVGPIDKKALKEAMSSRTYFHSKSCQVMQLSEVLNDHDSDDDCDIADHKQMNRHMLENSSANPSSDEKRFMLMWNMFLVLEPIFSDMQVPAACKRFAYLHAKALSAAPMRQNFVLHLVNMCTFKLLTPDEVQQCLTTVDKHGTKDMSNPK